MNACIRAAVRTAIYHNMEVFGIKYGYDGMIKGDIFPMDSHSVSNIVQKSGTKLKSARSKDFQNKKREGKSLLSIDQVWY